MRPDPEFPTAESAFTHFVRTGDPTALAATFDATAPELLRVAAFLVPRDDVEDVLHDTFRAALLRRAAYDASRPLLPWLLGMLANEARTVRRRAQMRRRERDAHAPTAERDPAIVASDRETATVFAQALQQLGRGEAELLHQHLVLDLSCREIASRAHKPAGTVRTQVARAMSELRRRLPVGLAIAPGFGGSDVRVLAPVRARLLANAPVLAAAGSLWPRARAWISGGVAIATIVLVTVFASRTEPGTAASQPTAVGQPALLAHGDSSPDSDALAHDRPSVRDPVPVTPPAWLLRGTVRAATGEPLPDALVRLRLVEMGAVLAAARTDAEGHYELDLAYWRDRPSLDRSGYGLVVVAEAPGRNDYTHLAKLPAATADRPLVLTHDFVLDPYLTLRGRTVDAQGTPVPAAVNAFGLAPGEPLQAIATADEQGVFRLVFTEEEPRVRIDARHAVAGRRRLEVDLPTSGERDLGDVVLEPGYTLRGRVALLDGTPVPDCRVFVRGGLQLVDGLPHVGPDYWYFDTHTGADGRFVANRPTLDTWAVRVDGALGLDCDVVNEERWLDATMDSVDLALDGVRLDLSWSDAEGRQLLPLATRVVVFAADAADAAAAARAGDAAAAHRALAERSTRAAHLVVPRGAHVWLQARGAGRFGVDRLLQVPMRNGPMAVDLRLAAAASTRLRVRVRFADGGVPETFTCTVQPEPGASLFGFEVQHRGPGAVDGRCAVGPVCVGVAAYADTFDGTVEQRSLVTQADRENEIEVVLARRGRVRFVLRDVTAPDRVGDDGVEGEVTIGSARAARFFWHADDMQYWGSPPLGRPVESMLMVPTGRHDVHFALDGYEPVTVPFDVTERDPELAVVWLHPR